MEGNREWTYQRHDKRGYLNTTFIQKVKEFIEFATKQEIYQITANVKCPCAKCWNVPYLVVDTMKLHLYKRGFQPNYYEWACHREAFDEILHPGSSSNVEGGDNLYEIS